MKLKESAENLEMGVDEFLEMIELFLETSASDLDQWQSGIDEGDGNKIMMAAHSIKGAAISLGLVDIYEVAKNTEMEARENNLNGAAVAATAIKEKMKQIAQDLLNAKSSKLKPESRRLKAGSRK
jgi:HPt (histidine-containing phosphotransfer) domain-containing protein